MPFGAGEREIEVFMLYVKDLYSTAVKGRQDEIKFSEFVWGLHDMLDEVQGKAVEFANVIAGLEP